MRAMEHDDTGWLISQSPGQTRWGTADEERARLRQQALAQKRWGRGLKVLPWTTSQGDSGFAAHHDGVLAICPSYRSGWRLKWARARLRWHFY